MIISPSTQRPKLQAADVKEAERFVAFCRMLINQQTDDPETGFDDKTIGPKAEAAMKAAEALLAAIKVEKLPEKKRPKDDDRPLLDQSEAAGESPDEDGGPATKVETEPAKSPGEGEVSE